MIMRFICYSRRPIVTLQFLRFPRARIGHLFCMIRDTRWQDTRVFP